MSVHTAVVVSYVTQGNIYCGSESFPKKIQFFYSFIHSFHGIMQAMLHKFTLFLKVVPSHTKNADDCVHYQTYFRHNLPLHLPVRRPSKISAIVNKLHAVDYTV